MAKRKLKQIFSAWQKIAGAKGDPWETEEDMMFLFDLLPPSGQGLEPICAGHPHGDQVLERLRRFYKDAAKAGEDPEEGTLFSRTKVRRKSDAKIQALILQQVANWREMALLAATDPKRDPIVKILGNPPTLSRAESPYDIEEDFDLQVAIGTDLPSAFEENVAQAHPTKNPLWYLTEALYTSAGNYYAVPNYILWPIHQGKSTLADPYLPGYELWLQNVLFAYTAKGKISYAIDEEEE